LLLISAVCLIVATVCLCFHHSDSADFDSKSAQFVVAAHFVDSHSKTVQFVVDHRFVVVGQSVVDPTSVQFVVDPRFVVVGQSADYHSKTVQFVDPRFVDRLFAVGQYARNLVVAHRFVVVGQSADCHSKTVQFVVDHRFVVVGQSVVDPMSVRFVVAHRFVGHVDPTSVHARRFVVGQFVAVVQMMMTSLR